jgi:hypothetical protein
VTFTTPRIAAVAGISALAGATAALIALPAQAPTGARNHVAPAPVEVRTRTVHRTIHVIRREPAPRRPVRRPPPAAAPAVQPTSPQAAAPVPAVATPTVRAQPLRTRTSGAGERGAGEREHERERGDD